MTPHRSRDGSAPTDHPLNGRPFPVGASTCLPLGQRDSGQGSQEGSQATGIPNPTTEIRISRHLLETVPAGVEETGRRLSSPGHGQRSKYKSLVYPTVACVLSGVVVCGTFLFVALCFRPTYRLGIPDRDKLKVSYLLPIFLYERFFYCAKRGARRLESQTLQLKFGLADIYSKLSRRVWRKREEDFRAQATAKEVSIRA